MSMKSLGKYLRDLYTPEILKELNEVCKREELQHKRKVKKFNKELAYKSTVY